MPESGCRPRQAADKRPALLPRPYPSARKVFAVVSHQTQGADRLQDHMTLTLQPRKRRPASESYLCSGTPAVREDSASQDLCTSSRNSRSRRRRSYEATAAPLPTNRGALLELG